MSNNNTLLKALATFITNKFKKNNENKEISKKEVHVVKKTRKKKEDHRAKEEKNEEKFGKLWLKNVNQAAMEAPRTPLKKRIPEMIGAFCVCLTLVTSITLLTVLSSTEQSGAKAYDTNVTKLEGDVFSALNTDNNQDRSFQYYDNLLKDGDLNFMTTKNISATGKYGTDVFLARTKTEQYEFLRQNNNTIFLAWAIRQNTKSLFPEYLDNELESIINLITESLYAITLRDFLGSNTTSINNYFQSLGYEDRSEYVENKLKPRAYIYFYLIDRMAKTNENDVLSSFNAKSALDLNTYYQVWGSKISKNYKELSTSSDFLCSNLEDISSIQGPSHEQWLKLANCKYINGDAVYATKSVGYDEVVGQSYTGYLGPMTTTDSSWISFCNFVSAQICEDAQYDPSQTLLEPIYNMFTALLESDSSFLEVNTYDVGLEETEANGEDTILIPYDNYYLIFKTLKIQATDVYEENSTTKLDLERTRVFESLINFLNNTRSSDVYRVFCNTNTAIDFSNTQYSITRDVEVYIFDVYTQFIFNDLCTDGIVF